MLTVIGCDLDQSIVRSSPDRPLLYWRFRKCEDSIIIFNRSDVVCEGAATRLLFAFIVAGKIAADLCPALSVIGRFENAFGGRVEHVWVVR